MTAGDPDENRAPRIAVVVMSYGLRPSLASAVRSVQDQDEPVEIVVVHSGEGDVADYFRQAAIDVRVAHSSARLLPGATRNAGIAATRAPVIAFLADDCLAEPGWVRERLQAHDAGARAVASALLCHKPNNPCALAAHLSLYVRRMPRAAPDVALTYGVSYAREVFETHGLFREDMESGEDTEFNKRLGRASKPLWCPNVRTVHIGADTLSGYISGQFRRGRRMADAWSTLGAHDKRSVARDAIARTSLIVREGLQVVDPEHRASAMLAVPLIACGNLAYALGAWTWRERAP
ncbi:MAG: glycosyltransferase family 2 protein [Hyphomonadaceae bacterium]|nr:glycosyltransferase family 2 protein [Hyphomonadaceae bacterium]